MGEAKTEITPEMLTDGFALGKIAKYVKTSKRDSKEPNGLGGVYEQSIS
jgi:hypothetical protein